MDAEATTFLSNGVLLAMRLVILAAFAGTAAAHNGYTLSESDDRRWGGRSGVLKVKSANAPLAVMFGLSAARGRRDPCASCVCAAVSRLHDNERRHPATMTRGVVRGDHACLISVGT